MASEPESYLAVFKASYDYEPQPDAEDEIALKEDQLLFLIERTDDELVSSSLTTITSNSSPNLICSTAGGRSR